MIAHFRSLVICVVLLSMEAQGRADEPAAPPRRDELGDRLPQGAFHRLGSARLRNGAGILTITYSPNGKWIASAGGTPWMAQGVNSGDRAVRVWDVESGKLVDEFVNHQTAVSCVAFTPDNKRVAACTLGDGTIFFWTIGAKKAEGPPAEPNTITVNQNGAGSMTFGFSPDGKTIAVSRGPQQEIALYDIESKKEIRVFGTHAVGIDSLTFAPGGKFLASKAGSVVRLWNVETGKIVRVFHPKSYHNKARFLSIETRMIAVFTTAPAVFSKDGKILAAEGNDNTLYLWDVETGKQLQRLVHQGPVAAASFSPDADRVVTGSHDNTLRVWEVRTGKELHHIEDHFGGYVITEFAPDGKSFASAGGDHSIRFWDAATGKELRPKPGHHGELILAAYHPDGRSLVSVGRDNFIRIWDTKTGRELRHFSDDEDTIHTVAFSHDGKRLATYNDDSCLIKLWDIETGKRVGLSGSIKLSGLTFSPDSQSVYFTDQAGSLYQQEVKALEGKLEGFENSRTTHRFKELNIVPGLFAFSSDGKKMAALTMEGHLQIWDTKTEKRLEQIEAANQNGAILSLGFSPDGSKVVLLMVGGDAMVWALNPGRLLYTLQKGGPQQFTNQVGSMSFSPDGRMLAVTGAQNSAAVVWDLQGGGERISFTGHRGPLTFVAFAPDGRSVASGSWDTTMLLWDIYGMHDATPQEFPERELETAWNDLGNTDSSRSFGAIRKLMQSPNQATALLSKQLKSIVPVSKDHIARLIRDLDNNNFNVRQKAFDDLDRLGGVAEEPLRKALATELPLEVRRRVEQLLEKLREGPVQGDQLQASRALEILEQLGNTDARGVLEKLAKGEPGAPLTRETRQALARLDRRKPQK
jgi:WD40 repeat protein